MKDLVEKLKYFTKSKGYDIKKAVFVFFCRYL